VLYRAMQAAAQAFDSGERGPDSLAQIVHETLASEPLASVDYVSVADADSLQELTAPITRPALVSVAVFMGDVRLIDNIVLNN
jgi:pantoate--beta-alanine ligase